jgi:hypothetical protein
MGQASSTTLEASVRDDEVLQRFCSATPIIDHGIFWNQDLRKSMEGLSLTSGGASLALPLMNPRLVDKCLSSVTDSLCM